MRQLLCRYCNAITVLLLPQLFLFIVASLCMKYALISVSTSEWCNIYTVTFLLYVDVFHFYLHFSIFSFPSLLFLLLLSAKKVKESSIKYLPCSFVCSTAIPGQMPTLLQSFSTKKVCGCNVFHIHMHLNLYFMPTLLKCRFKA